MSGISQTYCIWNTANIQKIWKYGSPCWQCSFSHKTSSKTAHKFAPPLKRKKLNNFPFRIFSSKYGNPMSLEIFHQLILPGNAALCLVPVMLRVDPLTVTVRVNFSELISIGLLKVKFSWIQPTMLVHDLGHLISDYIYVKIYTNQMEGGDDCLQSQYICTCNSG